MYSPSPAPRPFVTVSRLVFSHHVKLQAVANGFAASQIMRALTRPTRITEVVGHRAQWRFCGAGVAVVVDYSGQVPTAVTVYLDGDVAPLRQDQTGDPAAVGDRRAVRA